MNNTLTVSETAARLAAQDRVLILTHHYPDGDTIGSAFALCLALRARGRQAQVVCSDPIPEKYAYITEKVPEQTFTPAFYCAVDVADCALLGDTLAPLADKVNLTIDHHASHRDFGGELLLDSSCGANAMIVYTVIKEMGVTVTPLMADCLYTGLATDTGCFKYGNTSPLTHRMAAELMEAGAQYESINRSMFDIKSRARIALERAALSSMTYAFHNRCAFMLISNDMVAQSGAKENDMEGLAPLPRQIEGVWVGVTLRQKPDGCFKVSVRTGHQANASAICQTLGGGGHAQAAGCTVTGTVDEAIAVLQRAIVTIVPAIND